jgi:predicted nucleic acid-binding protein
MGDGPYLFDVGVVALAHAGTSVSETARSYVTDAIEGTIDAVVPYPALFGAQVVLTNYYGVSNADASCLVENFADASRVHWSDEMPESTVRAGFDLAAEHSIDG